jgi:outer membrane biogenesis lipoprotein LolB
MKHLVLVSAVALCLFAGCAMTAEDNVTAEATSELGASRLDVVFAAYRGQLSAQGIPSYQTFCNQFKWGQLSEQKVANAAAKAGLISSEQAADSSYVWQLKQSLRSVCR